MNHLKGYGVCRQSLESTCLRLHILLGQNQRIFVSEKSLFSGKYLRIIESLKATNVPKYVYALLTFIDIWHSFSALPLLLSEQREL